MRQRYLSGVERVIRRVNSSQASAGWNQPVVMVE
jgi:hypothetical protein